jgi:signal transduction histidine kinase
VAAAARFAMVNARLQAEVRAKLVAVEASRRRLVTAADDERRQLEERLRHGVERRLAEVQARLAEAGPLLSPWASQVAAARRSVHELALGLHPPALSDGDLAGALRGLAVGSAVPVRLDLDDALVPSQVAMAAYFVCAEAITNVAKYAAATRLGIRTAVAQGALQVVVTDDGRGGADPARGTGLRGLIDRAEALGGALVVTSPPHGGTTVTLRLPLVDERPAVPVQSRRSADVVGAVR